MRGSAATLRLSGRATVATLGHRLRNTALPPVLAVVLAGAGGYVGPAQRWDAAPVAAVAVSPTDGARTSGPTPPSIVLAAPERALEALRIVAVGTQTTVNGAVLFEAYVTAVGSAPARCHLSASVLAALGQAEPGPLGGTGSPRELAAAVAATAGSLCANGRDLARPADLRRALLARTGSPVVVQLVLTLKARFDLMGLGLVGAPGPVLVPLLLEQATALVADPYGPAEVFPSRVRSDGGVRRPAASPADVGEPTGPPVAQVTRAQVQAGSGSASPSSTVPDRPAESAPAMPANSPADDQDSAAPPGSAAPDPATGPASPSAVDVSTGSGDASGSPEPSAAPQDPGTDVVEPACTIDVVEAPDAGAPSASPSTSVIEPADPLDPAATPVEAADACTTQVTPDPAGDTTTEPDPSVGASPAATPEPTQEPAPALP